MAVRNDEAWPRRKLARPIGVGRLFSVVVESGFRFGLLLKTKGRIGFISFLTLGSSKARPPVSGDATKAVFSISCNIP